MPPPVVAQHPVRHPYIDHAISAVDRSIDVDVFDLAVLRAASPSVVHVHFGFETRTAAELDRWIDGLEAADIRLVHTVHDLDNPHLVDQTAFHAAVGLLVRRSGAVLTLTDAARAVIAERYGRTAEVVPHPHILERGLLETMDRCAHRSPPQRRGRIYVHASTMRPNLDVALIHRVAAAAATSEVGISVHVRDSVSAGDVARLRHGCSHDAIEVLSEPRLSDQQLCERIAGSALVLLPYRWGTHSGLLELSHDLGVPVLAPRFGGFVDQGAHPIDEHDLAGSVAAALAGRPTITPRQRLDEADRLARFHHGLYGARGEAS